MEKTVQFMTLPIRRLWHSHRGLAAAMFAFWSVVLLVWALRFGDIFRALYSLGLSVILLIADFSSVARIFNPDLMDDWLAALTAVLIPWLLIRTERWLISETPFTFVEILKTSRSVLFSSTVLLILVLAAFLSPLLAPYDPYFQQDAIVTRLKEPGTSVQQINVLDTVNSSVPIRSGGGWSDGISNSLIRVNHTLLFPTPKLIFADSLREGQDSLFFFQGHRSGSIPATEVVSTEERRFVLGSDNFGRDLLSRMIAGSRISLSVGVLSVLLAIFLGVTVGSIAGYFRGRTDAVLMRVVDLMMSFPSLFLVLMVMALFGESVWLMILVLGLTSWMGVARLTRGQFLSLREQEFVMAARAGGLSSSRIIFRHILPNAMAPIIVAATLRLGTMILMEAGLSFLGLGVHPPTPTWGNMIDEGRNVLLQAWWISTFPGVAIVITVIALNVLGDGLRDSLDPRLRNLLR